MFRNLFRTALAATGVMAAAVALGATALTISGPTPASAVTGPPWPDVIYGVPTGFEAGATNGWYFWKDEDRFFVCSTTPSELSHPFEATLVTNGTFRDVRMATLEEADDIRILNGGKRMVLRFDTHNGVDCASFSTDGTKLNLRLREFGRLVPRSHIFVGQGNVHPPSNPWTITR